MLKVQGVRDAVAKRDDFNFLAVTNASEAFSCWPLQKTMFGADL